VVHVEEMVLPEGIDGLEEKIVFQVSHHRLTEGFLPGFVPLHDLLQEVFAQFLGRNASRSSTVKAACIPKRRKSSLLRDSRFQSSA